MKRARCRRCSTENVVEMTGTAGRAIAAAMSATYEIVPVAHSKGEYWVYLAVPASINMSKWAVTQLSSEIRYSPTLTSCNPKSLIGFERYAPFRCELTLVSQFCPS
jgi:hypothetical protein